MKKKELLKMIDGSTLKFSDKSNLYNEYYPLIDATLRFCPEDINLVGLSSLEGLKNSDSFERLVIGCSENELRKKLEAIVTDLDTLANRYISENSEKFRKESTALAISNDWLNYRQHKNRIVYSLLIALFIIFSVAVVLFAGLDAGGVFDEGTVMAKVCAIVPSVSGALDCVNGIAFFIYERNDDKKKKANQSDLGEITGAKNSGNKVRAGKNSKVIIGDCYYGSASEDGAGNQDKKLRSYIVKNSGNSVRAGKGSNVRIGDQY